MRVNEEKMSKSLGNFFTVREVLKAYRPEVVRFFILNSHYRSPLNYSQESLEEAQAGLTRLYTALRGVDVSPIEGFPDSEPARRFSAALDDDFNTAEAVAVLFELAREINRFKTSDTAQAELLAQSLKRMAAVLGLLQDSPDAFMKSAGGHADGLSDTDIEALIQQRLAARADRNWAEADRIRDRLKEEGVLLEDAAGQTLWRRG